MYNFHVILLEKVNDRVGYTHTYYNSAHTGAQEILVRTCGHVKSLPHFKFDNLNSGDHIWVHQGHNFGNLILGMFPLHLVVLFYILVTVKPIPKHFHGALHHAPRIYVLLR